MSVRKREGDGAGTGIFLENIEWNWSNWKSGKSKETQKTARVEREKKEKNVN